MVRRLREVGKRLDDMNAISPEGITVSSVVLGHANGELCERFSHPEKAPANGNVSEGDEFGHASILPLRALLAQAVRLQGNLTTEYSEYTEGKDRWGQEDEIAEGQNGDAIGRRWL